MKTAGQTICLSMIVKNEAPVICRCLESVRTIIDYWVIVDTGSTDGTQDIIRAHLKDLPGELHERPWRDFAYNRSEALTLARARGDFSLIIDADDALEFPEGFQLPKLTADSYTVVIRDATVQYQRPQLVRNTLPWRYQGVLHEYLTCEASQSVDHLHIVMRRNHDGARRRDPETYRKDAAVLEQALIGETDLFLQSRYTFYLAQSYRDCGEKEKALEKYLARVDLGFWQDEIFISLLQAARLRNELGRSDQEVLDTYARATEALPTRAEALHGASRHLRYKSRFEEGYQLAKRGVELGLPGGGLFVETWIYEYGLLDELVVNAYWSGHYQDAIDACERIVSTGKCPADQRDRILANANFARQKLEETATGTRAKTKVDELPDPNIQKSNETRYPVSTWVPKEARGGTEVMLKGLRSRLASALDRIDLKINLFSLEELSGKPLVVWIHHNINEHAVQWCRDQRMVSRVAIFVFVSNWQMGRYIEVFGLPSHRCVVLKNAISISEPLRAWKPGAICRVAYVSTPFRGLDVLLDAWDWLRPERAELHIWSSLRLYGQVFSDEKFTKLFERAQTLPNVFYRGIIPNEQLRDELRNVDYLAYPSTFEETSCLAVIEAMAAGCRVICPSLGALPETSGQFARLYPIASDPAQHARLFAHTLQDEIQNPWNGKSEQAKCQQNWIRDIYDWSVRIDEWRALIDSLTVSDDPCAPQLASEAGELVPTSGTQLEAIENFRNRMAALATTTVTATPHWQARCRQMIADSHEQKNSSFLRWPSFVDFSVPEFAVFPSWYRRLLADWDWVGRWSHLTREDLFVGAPRPLSIDVGTSPI